MCFPLASFSPVANYNSRTLLQECHGLQLINVYLDSHKDERLRCIFWNMNHGIVVRKHLKKAEQRALEDKKAASDTFRSWAMWFVPGAKYMNVGSGAQVQQLLFPGVSRQTSSNSGRVEYMPVERVFKVPHLCTHLPNRSLGWALGFVAACAIMMSLDKKYPG